MIALYQELYLCSICLLWILIQLCMIMSKLVFSVQHLSVVLRIWSCYALWMHNKYFLQELEPFPELKIFDEIRNFHEELCQTYSIRDHILKVKNYSLRSFLIVIF